jgi:hypothetical protein
LAILEIRREFHEVGTTFSIAPSHPKCGRKEKVFSIAMKLPDQAELF